MCQRLAHTCAKVASISTIWQHGKAHLLISQVLRKHTRQSQRIIIMSVSFVSSAPGKVILSGEHSVVHSKLALAAVVGKRSFAEFQISAESTGIVSLQVLSSSGQKEFKWSLQDLQQLWQQHGEIVGKHGANNFRCLFQNPFALQSTCSNALNY